MRRYWGKITLGALLIFVVGYGIISAGRSVKDSIVTSKDITIPLGSFVPFKLGDVKVGSIRSLKIHREGDHGLSGFDLRVRIDSAASFEQLTDCKLSVTDARNFDERTSFLCLQSDSGYQAFGEVTITLNDPNSDRMLGTPLLLPESVVQDLQQSRGHREASLADSLAGEVQNRVRPISRAYRDSVRAADLDRESERIKARADSIRARAKERAQTAPDSPNLPPKPL